MLALVAFAMQCSVLLHRSVVLGMGDGSMMTLTIADPEKKGISEYLKTLPSRNPVGCPAGPIPGIGSGYMQVGKGNTFNLKY